MYEVKHRNGIRHNDLVKQGARELRIRGKTHREIAEELGISLGSAYLWTIGIALTPEQKRDIQERRYKPTFTESRRAKLREMARVNLARYREKHTRESLLNKIVDFYSKHGRIPLKREFNMYGEYKRKFRSWNEAIEVAGFNPNPQIFSYKFKAKDGHNCDSFTEKIIDDWLFDRGIQHERSVKYGDTKLTADFMIRPNTVLEFFGLAGAQKVYDSIIVRKRELCKKLNLKLIEVYPENIFPKNHLSDLISAP